MNQNLSKIVKIKKSLKLEINVEQNSSGMGDSDIENSQYGLPINELFKLFLNDQTEQEKKKNLKRFMSCK